MAWIPRLIRVASFNNFYHTQEDHDEIVRRTRMHRDTDLIVVNTVAFDALYDRTWPIIITLNPHLESHIEPHGSRGAMAQIVAARVKWVPYPTPVVHEAFLEGLRWCADHGIPALITKMRFRRIALMYRYCENPPDGYCYRAPQFWSKVPYLRRRYERYCPTELQALCDDKLLGCPACRNCLTLSYPDAKSGAYRIMSMNLEASRASYHGRSKKGYPHCIHACPECYAAARIAKGGGEPNYTDIKPNKKQKGHDEMPPCRDLKIDAAKKRFAVMAAAGWPKGMPTTPRYVGGQWAKDPGAEYGANPSDDEGCGEIWPSAKELFGGSSQCVGPFDPDDIEFESLEDVERDRRDKYSLRGL